MMSDIDASQAVTTTTRRNSDGTAFVVTCDPLGKVLSEEVAPDTVPSEPTDIERLAAVLVDKTGMTDEEAAKALGVDAARLTKARERVSEAVTDAEPVKR